MQDLAGKLVGKMGVAAFNADLRERSTAKFEAALTAEEAAGLFDINRLQAAISGPGAPAAQTDIYRIQNLMRLSDIMRGSGRTAVDLAAELLKIGCTLRFRDIDQFDRQLAGFSRAAAEVYAAETQVNVYFTPPRQDGFSPHFDTTDVFIVQVAGSKNWLIHTDYTDKQVLPGPDVDWSPERFRPLGSATALTLRAGDVLYIPRGFMHSASCRDEESMHLTVTLSPMTMLGALERELRHLAAEDVALRRRVEWSVAGGADEARTIRRELRRLMGALADKVDGSAAVGEERALLTKAAEPANAFAETVASLKVRPDGDA